MGFSVRHYIERKADNELYERTLAGDFCYVLTPRQTGKSSLMARTADRLSEEGIRRAIVDLTQIGTEEKKKTADRWYFGIAYRITKELGINIKLFAWWREREKLPALQRLTDFFSDVILSNVNGRVVIFVDEIDTTIVLPFTDDFFAAIRACYNARAIQPEYKRLSFVLLGVASPSELIKDTRRTPFNIGVRIDLSDFTFDEARPLARHLGTIHNQREEVLKRILYWSNGHPYLTQKLCHLVADERLDTYSGVFIDNLVDKYFLRRAEQSYYREPDAHRYESNLKVIRDRLVQNNRYSRKMLKLYRRILKGHRIFDEPLSSIQLALKLSGLVITQKNGQLEVRNRIYKEFFTEIWVKGVLPSDRNRNFALTSIALLILIFTIWYPKSSAKPYIEIIRTAQDDVPTYAYEKLRKTPGYADKADNLFADYWDRRALRAENQGKRDDSLLYRLKALNVKETKRRRCEIGLLTKNSYENLIYTYRHSGFVNAVTFNPKGTIVLTGSSDKTARLWRTDTGIPFGKVLKHKDGIYAVAFSSDGNTVLTGGADGVAHLWRADSGKHKGNPMEHGSLILGVDFSPTGDTVLTGGYDGTARLWEANTGKPFGKAMNSESPIRAVAFSPDGSTIITGGDDCTARLWCSNTGLPLNQSMKHESFVISAAFSPDGSTVLTSTLNGVAHLWEVVTGKPKGKPIIHWRKIFGVSFSPDEKTILTASIEGTVQLWSTHNNKPLGKSIKYEGFVRDACLSPDGSTFVTGSMDGTARLWHTNFSKSIETPIKHEYGLPINAVLFNSNGRSILTCNIKGTIRLWQSDNGEFLGTIIKNVGSIRALAFSPDGKILLTGSEEGTVRLWQSSSGLALGKPMNHKNSISAVVFSPDGEKILTVSDDGTVRLWWTDTQELAGTPIRHSDFVTATAFSPDGKKLLTGCQDDIARLWHADTGTLISIMKHGNSVSSVAFSPDGKTVLTGGSDGTVRLWHADTGKPLAPHLKHRGYVSSVAFSPDGKTVVTTTNWWIHQMSLSDGELNPKASRFFPGTWTDTYRFLDGSGDQMQVAVIVPGNAIQIVNLRFDIPDAPPIEGDPEKLLEEWQKKLALKLDEVTGKIEPMYPVEAPERRPGEDLERR